MFKKVAKKLKIKEKDLFNPIYVNIYTQAYALYVSDEKNTQIIELPVFGKRKNKVIDSIHYYYFAYLLLRHVVG